MDKVLIFTNYNSWYRGLKKITKRVDWYDSYPDLNNPLVKCVVEQGAKTTLQPVDNLSEDGVYLVFDEIIQDELYPLLDKCKQDKDRLFILLHSHGYYKSTKYFEPWEEISTFASGRHQSDMNYEHIFDILTDNLGDKTNRIINSAFIFEVVIKFLQDSHSPHKELEKILSYQILSEKGFGDAMKTFKEKYDSCNSFSEYEEDYNKLNALLMKRSKK